MKPKDHKPPRLGEKLLLRFLRDDLAEEVLGDLDEKFYAEAKNKSIFRARLNYWYQVINYLRPFALKKSKYPSIYYPMYQSYFKIGWRNLLKNKGYSAINIGGLAAGMIVSMMMGFWIYDELSYNKYHRNYNTIGKIFRKMVWEGEVDVSTPQTTGLGTLLKTEYRAHFQNVVMARGQLEERVIAFGEKKFTQGGYFMESEGIEMFGIKILQGNGDGIKKPNSILLSESLAKKIFGYKDPINQTVKMNARWDLTVTGVYEDLPDNTEFNNGTFFAPLDIYLDGQSINTWDNYHITIYAQIHPDADFEKINGIIKDITKPHAGEKALQAKQQIFLHPMSKWHLFTQFENGVNVTSERLKFVWFNGVIGVFVLLLACINFMNLSTARSEKRAKEVGIRKSIGSQRGQLIQQFFGESLLVAVLSFILAIVITRLLLPSFNSISDKNISMPWANYKFWLAGIAFTILTGLIAGSYPALYLSSFSPLKVMKGTFKAGRFASLPRRILVVIQFTVSISLIIGTAIVYKQLQFAKNRPIGYTRESLISLRIASPDYNGKYDVLRNELKKSGAVDEIASSNYSITSTLGWNGGFSWNGRAIEPSFNTIFVSPEYGKTIGFEFISGRDFSREFASDMSGIIINESAAKLIGLENPVGESLKWSPGGSDRGSYKILGIVKDMVKGSPFEPTDPSIIFVSKNDLPNLYIRINPKVSPHEALPKIESVFNKLIPSAPFDYKFADDEYAAKFRAEERIGTLTTIFSVLAILISCSGLFGLSSFIAEQRTKEISIRKVLGASVANVWTLLSKEYILLVVISCFIAIPLSYSFMIKWLQQYEYRTSVPWPLLLLSGFVALGITLVTVSYQAIKAATANPVNALKSE